MLRQELYKRIQVLSFVFILPFLFSNTGKSSPASTHKITITFKKIRNSKGRIQLQVYRNQSSFAAENPYKLFYVSKSDLSNGSMTYTIELPGGTYGLALLDDENSNKKMDYSFFMPTEGFGFSDYYHSGLSRPVFDDFKFELNADKKVTMVARYM